MPARYNPLRQINLEPVHQNRLKFMSEENFSPTHENLTKLVGMFESDFRVFLNEYIKRERKTFARGRRRETKREHIVNIINAILKKPELVSDSRYNYIMKSIYAKFSLFILEKYPETREKIKQEGINAFTEYLTEKGLPVSGPLCDYVMEKIMKNQQYLLSEDFKKVSFLLNKAEEDYLQTIAKTKKLVYNAFQKAGKKAVAENFNTIQAALPSRHRLKNIKPENISPRDQWKLIEFFAGNEINKFNSPQQIDRMFVDANKEFEKARTEAEKDAITQKYDNKLNNTVEKLIQKKIAELKEMQRTRAITVAQTGNTRVPSRAERITAYVPPSKEKAKPNNKKTVKPKRKSPAELERDRKQNALDKINLTNKFLAKTLNRAVNTKRISLGRMEAIAENKLFQVRIAKVLDKGFPGKWGEKYAGVLVETMFAIRGGIRNEDVVKVVNREIQNAGLQGKKNLAKEFIEWLEKNGVINSTHMQGNATFLE